MLTIFHEFEVDGGLFVGKDVIDDEKCECAEGGGGESMFVGQPCFCEFEDGSFFI